jgi:hypothetical protein
VTLLAVYRGQWPNVWTSALKWYEKQLFFNFFFIRILRWFCLISNLIRPNLAGCKKDAFPTYSSLTTNFYFGPPLSPHEVWAWGFSAPCIHNV